MEKKLGRQCKRYEDKNEMETWGRCRTNQGMTLKEINVTIKSDRGDEKVGGALREQTG